MKLLIKKAKVLNIHSSHHGKTVDIFINKGKIEAIKSSISDDGSAKVISSPQLHISPGWVDIGTNIGEPGLEHREDLQSIVRAAKAGGYTAIAPFPNTVPVVQTKAAIQYLLDAARRLNIAIYPIAAMSVDCKGGDITEMIDLNRSGALAFSDGLKSAENSGLLYRALQYAKSFQGLIIHHSSDKHIAIDGQMHEGMTSTSLGVKGIPSIAETIALRRDIDLLQYTDSRLCVYGVSSSEGLRIVKDGKKINDHLSAAVPYLNLIKTDNDLQSFDSNLKVLPPIRGKKDKQELLKAINDDTIDAIVSNHVPLDEESKKLEFTYALFGASGIETCFAALHTYCSRELELEKIIYKLGVGPRNILGIEIPDFAVGSDIDATLFDPSIEWEFTTTHSKSDNNPFLGKKLLGKVVGTLG